MSAAIGLKTNTFSVPGGSVSAPGSLKVPMSGSAVLCRTSTGSTGDIKARFEGGGNISFDAGDFYNFGKGNEFSEFYLENTNAAAVTVTVTVGAGDFRMSSAAQVTNTVDVKNTTGNALFVQNATGGTLSTSDTAAQTKLDTLHTDVAAINTTLKSPTTLRAGALDLTGCSVATVSATTTAEVVTHVVTAAANVNGVYIAACACTTGTSQAGRGNLRAGAGPDDVGAWASGNAFSAGNVINQPVFIPAGLAVDIIAFGATTKTTCWYKVL